MKIGVDLDDVLFAFNRSMYGYYNDKLGYNIQYEDIHSFDIDKIWKCTPEQVHERVGVYYQTKSHAEAPSVDGAIEAVDTLSKHFELHIITSRPHEIEDVTLEWIHKNFPNKFKSIHLTNQFSKAGSKHVSKSTICKNLGINLMIDDALHNVLDLNKNGIKVILLNTPWNQEKVPDTILRMSNWKEITDYLIKNHL